MARLFLDTNTFIDIIEKRASISIESFKHYTLFISPLSVHILTYLYKYKVPDSKLDNLEKYYNIVAFDLSVVLDSITGPTSDFEDNVQLHSAAEVDADFFFTRDKRLLALKFFGKTEIVNRIIPD